MMVPLLALLLALPAPFILPQTDALPLVDAGLFVILGVSTCRDGTGYCLLGSDCTLDHDFSPDDTGGHCNGLRAAFTPAANFVCCKYNGAPNDKASTVTSTTSSMSSSTSSIPQTTTPAATPIVFSQPPKPSRRPVIDGQGGKPAATDADSAPGAVFWVDLDGNKNSKPNTSVYTKLGETHPGSALTLSGTVQPANIKVPVMNTASLEGWLRPGMTMDVPALIASKPGSTVTLAERDEELLNGIVQGISAEVAHGISITQSDTTHPTPALEISVQTSDEAQPEEPTPEVGAIESHEPLEDGELEGLQPPVAEQEVLNKPDWVSLKPGETADNVVSGGLRPQPPATSAPVVPISSSTSKPSTSTTTAAPAEPEDSGDEEDEEEEESEEEDEEDEDDGLFGFSDLVDLLGFDTASSASSLTGASRNATPGGAAETKEGDTVLQAELEERMDVDSNSTNIDDEEDPDDEEEGEESENLVGGFLSESSTLQPSSTGAPAEKEVVTERVKEPAVPEKVKEKIAFDQEQAETTTLQAQEENAVVSFSEPGKVPLKAPQQPTPPPIPQELQEEEEEEAPPLCLGPVREPRDPACWAVQFVQAQSANSSEEEKLARGSSKALCSGARVARDLVVTSASCAVRVFMAGVHETRALLPGGGGGAAVSEVVVHENYRAAPHAALHDIGLVRLVAGPADLEMGACTLCLPQETKADFSQSACQSPRFESYTLGSAEEGVESGDHGESLGVQLEARGTASRAVCELVTRNRTEDDDRFPTFLCAPPPRSTKQSTQHLASRVGPSEGSPLVCRGRRSIPVLAGVLMSASASAKPSNQTDWSLFTPLSHYVEWIQANQLPAAIAAAARGQL